MNYLMKFIPHETSDDVKLRPLILNRTPFAWQDVRVIRLIRERFRGKRLSSALAIYLILTEQASIAGRGQGKHVNQFRAYLGTIAEYSGKSVVTIKRYCKEFKQLGILDWENRRRGKFNLANLWKLLDYPGQDNTPTSPHNNEPRTRAHNNEPLREEDGRNFISKKGRTYNSKPHDGFTHIKDIMDRQMNE